MKTDRLAIILDLIASEDIDSQETMVAKLNERGLAVTQATVSRDIKKLGLIKMRTTTGGFKYVVGAEFTTGSNDETREGSPNQLAKKGSNNRYFTIQDGVLLKYTGQEEVVVIPGNVTEIAKNAFYRKTTPKCITIPSTVKVLQPYALAECKSLEKLVIEPGQTIIPEGLCNCCRNLKEVNLPEGIISIGEKAFHACPIFHFSFPSTLKEIGDSAFNEDPLMEVILPEGVESIGSYAFSDATCDKIIVPASCKLLGNCFCKAVNIKTLVILSDSVKAKPIRYLTIDYSIFTTSLLFNSWEEDKVKSSLPVTVYCSDNVKKRLPKCWHNKCKPLSEWGGDNKVQKADETAPTHINIYKLPDETIKRLLVGSDDPIAALEKRKFPRKTKFEIETSQGTVSVVNQAYTDIKRACNEYYEACFDMYVAIDHYLDKDTVASRIDLADGGHSDASWFATPEIDWDAPGLTEEQRAIRLLMLAKVADTFLQGDCLKEIIESMPKKKNGTLMKNRVTRIASGNIVSKEARVLELAAKADSESSIVLFADYRSFSSEELSLIENDYLSTHWHALNWDIDREEIDKTTQIEKGPSRNEVIQELKQKWLSGKGEWAFAWKKRFNEDPVFREVATTLVWITRERTNFRYSFRVKSNGLCLLADGNEVSIPDQFKIALAYGPHLEINEWRKWRFDFEKEKIQQPFMQLKETSYNPEKIEYTDEQERTLYSLSQHDRIVTRYHGIEVWYGSLKECLNDGYELRRYPDQAEQILFPNSICFMWAPFDSNKGLFYPYEEPVFSEVLILGKLRLSDGDYSDNGFPRPVNHFFFMMDMVCVKDAIHKNNLALLKERSKFLSVDNIQECIDLAKTEKAADCLAWLEDQKTIM